MRKLRRPSRGQKLKNMVGRSIAVLLFVLSAPLVSDEIALGAPLGYRLPFAGAVSVTNGPGCGYHIGPRREGVDFGGRFTVLATERGTVVRLWDDPNNRDFRKGPAYGFGRLVVIRHPDGRYSYYGHLESFAVELGRAVGRGDPVGTSGSTGFSFGVHLHFEVRERGRDGDQFKLPGGDPVSIRDLPGISWSPANRCKGRAEGPPVGPNLVIESADISVLYAVPGRTRIRVSATVYNAGDQPAPTSGSAPGAILTEDSQFVDAAPGHWRIGVHSVGAAGIGHRWRWGFGENVPPQGRRSAQGFLDLTTPGTSTLYLGLVEEHVAWKPERYEPSVRSVTVDAHRPALLLENAEISVVYAVPGRTRIRVSATVYNAGDRPAPMGGPGPGAVLAEDSPVVDAVPGEWRIGVHSDGAAGSVEHRWRWGFGEEIPPQARRSTHGFLDLTTPGTRTFYIGLVEEYVEWKPWRYDPSLRAVTVAAGDPQFYAARYEPLSIPPILRAGEEGRATVAITNTSSSAWPSGSVRVSYHWLHPSGAVADWDGLRTELARIEPGQRVQLDAMRLRAPPIPGAYVLEFDLVHEGFAWFSVKGYPGPRSAVTVTASGPARPALAASYAVAPPASWAPGQQQTYGLSVTNGGDETWRASGTNRVRLGVHFGTANDGVSVGWATDQRFELPFDVAPGSSVPLTVSVTAPSAAGSYVLRHRMVKEFVAWFDQIDRTNVSVVSAAPDTLTITRPLSLSAPSGLVTGAPLTFTFAVKNPTSVPVEAALISVPTRGPGGQGVDLTCAGGSNVRLAPGAEFVCTATGTFSVVGAYTYWADWLLGTSTWHDPESPSPLSPYQQFTLTAAPPATLVLGQVTASAPSGWFVSAPINFNFVARNYGSAPVTAARIQVPVRDAAATEALDVACAGGLNVTIPPGGQFSCQASGSFATPGTYAYWADWYDGTRWFGSPQDSSAGQFTLATPAPGSLVIVNEVTASAASGWVVNAPITFRFVARNPGSTPFTAARIQVPIRDAVGAPLDVACDPWLDVTIPPGGQFTCQATKSFAAPGTYTYWADWYDGANWHTGQLGPNQQFTLTAP